MIGAKPVIGRTFVADDHDSKIARVAVLSYGLWQRDFAGSRSVIGRTINLDGAPRVVIGVMAPRFEYPKATTAVWIPRARFNLDSLGDRDQHYLFMVGRLRSGFTLDQARAEALGVARAIMRAEPAKFDPKAPLTPRLIGVREELVGQTRPYLLALLGAVGFHLVDRVRERREPPVGARRGAGEGAGRADRARRLSTAAGRATVDRRRCVVGDRRRA